MAEHEAPLEFRWWVERVDRAFAQHEQQDDARFNALTDTVNSLKTTLAVNTEVQAAVAKATDRLATATEGRKDRLVDTNVAVWGVLFLALAAVGGIGSFVAAVMR